MTFNKDVRRKFWAKRMIFIPVFVVAGLFIFGNLVMYLWNALLPGIIGVSTITFWQALGLLVLSKILFGGFSHQRCYNGVRGRDYYKLREKWMHMSPEQKEDFKNKMRNKFESPEKSQ